MTSRQIYLVDPNFRLRWIPNEQVYFSLWETWDGIQTVPNLWSCFNSSNTLIDAKLRRLRSSNAVYIWDYSPPDGVSGWRHITSEAVFNKYAFSWAKVQVVDSDFFPKSGFLWNF